MKILISVTFVALFILSAPASAAEDIEIPFRLGKGQLLFERYCSSCHGVSLEGSEQGPPLIHGFYKPSHHGDNAFYRAALEGVRAHHWDFGDMPPVVGMTRGKMDTILPYIRYYQQQKKLF